MVKNTDSGINCFCTLLVIVSLLTVVKKNETQEFDKLLT